MVTANTISQPRNLAGALMALRGVIMLVAGLFALFYPVLALRLLIFVGGGILVVDGILNLVVTDLRGPREPLFWVRVARSGLAIAAGLAILLSPFLSWLLSRTFLVYFVGIQALVVGALEVLSAVMAARADKRWPWQLLVSGSAYALFGLALIVLSLGSATMLTQIVGVLMAVFGASLMSRLWR